MKTNNLFRLLAPFLATLSTLWSSDMASAAAILRSDNRSIHTDAHRSFTTFEYWTKTETPLSPFAIFDANLSEQFVRPPRSPWPLGDDTTWGVRGSASQTSEVSQAVFSGDGSASGTSYAIFGIPIDSSYSISTFEVYFEISTPHLFEISADVTGLTSSPYDGWGNAAVLLSGPSSFVVDAGTSYGRQPSDSLTATGLLVPGVYRFFAFADAISVGNRDEDRPVVDDNDASASFSFVFRLTDAVPNMPPVAKCKNVSVSADSNCSANASVDDGSYDPDGGSINVAQTPAGPYPLGQTTVTLTATDNGGLSTSCTATVTVIDIMSPVVMCIPEMTPASHNIPDAGSRDVSTSDPNGFFKLIASDSCDPAPRIFIQDSASGFVTGPFASGDNVKITQAPGVAPNSKPLSGLIVAHIQLKGDALIYGVDAAGNKSAPLTALVPPDRK